MCILELHALGIHVWFSHGACSGDNQIELIYLLNVIRVLNFVVVTICCLIPGSNAWSNE